MKNSFNTDDTTDDLIVELFVKESNQLMDSILANMSQMQLIELLM